MVSIVTTASGTYSSDALTSPYVRYPGIDVDPDLRGDQFTAGDVDHDGRAARGTWTSVTSGSITYFSYGPVGGAHV